MYTIIKWQVSTLTGRFIPCAPYVTCLDLPFISEVWKQEPLLSVIFFSLPCFSSWSKVHFPPSSSHPIFSPSPILHFMSSVLKPFCSSVIFSASPSVLFSVSALFHHRPPICFALGKSFQLCFPLRCSSNTWRLLSLCLSHWSTKRRRFIRDSTGYKLYSQLVAQFSSKSFKQLYTEATKISEGISQLASAALTVVFWNICHLFGYVCVCVWEVWRNCTAMS